MNEPSRRLTRTNVYISLVFREVAVNEYRFRREEREGMGGKTTTSTLELSS